MSTLDKIQYFLPRFLFLNTVLGARCHYGDIVRVLKQFEDNEVDLASGDFWAKWQAGMMGIAEEYRHLSDQCTQLPLKNQYLKSAAACYHFAEFMYFEDKALKTWMREQAKECFLSTFNHAQYGLHVGEIVYEKVGVPYYLIMPRGIDQKLPCVVMSNGLDSVTEVEIMAIAERFLSLGMAVLIFEGPGQGINLGQSALCLQMEAVVERLLYDLSDMHQIDWERLGFFGISFGGYVALRVANFLGERFEFVVNYSGGPKIAPFHTLKRRLKADFQFAFGLKDAAIMQEVFDQCELAITACDTKILSIHGECDDIFPVSDLVKLDKQLNDQHELIIYPQERHVCLNFLEEITLKISERFYKNLVLQGIKSEVG